MIKQNTDVYSLRQACQSEDEDRLQQSGRHDREDIQGLSQRDGLIRNDGIRCGGLVGEGEGAQEREFAA